MSKKRCQNKMEILHSASYARNILEKKLTVSEKKTIATAVKRVVKEYGEVLRRLGGE